MKKCLVIFALLFVGGIKILGQLSDESSILPFLKDSQFFIDQIERDEYIINKLEFDLVFSNSTKSTPVNLNKNQNYKILLFGETGKILDIDLKIKVYVNNKWITVKEINSPTNILNTDFTPTTSDFYEFEIIASKLASGYTVGRYCLIVSII